MVHSAAKLVPVVRTDQATSSPRRKKGKGRKLNDDDDDSFSRAPQPIFNIRGSSLALPQRGNRFAALTQEEEE